VELQYQNGHLHGKVRRWSEEGTLLVEVPYRNGLMDGESRFFNRKGKLLGTSKLVQGTGTYRIWDRNKDQPVLIKEVEYVDGKELPKP
jgi:antitoxin component YwqK of YwqJK toxin-antitoxin module